MQVHGALINLHAFASLHLLNDLAYLIGLPEKVRLIKVAREKSPQVKGRYKKKIAKKVC